MTRSPILMGSGNWPPVGTAIRRSTPVFHGRAKRPVWPARLHSATLGTARARIFPMKAFSQLTPREILAVAVASEEEDARIYMTFADDLRERYPASAKIFDEMAAEEAEHRKRLLDMYEKRFGPKLPPIRREDVKGFLKRRPIWLTANLTLDTMRKEAAAMEYQAARFYCRAAEQTTDVEVRRLLGDLAEAESKHETHALELEKSILTPNVR